jgi:hypothetical protein
MYPHPFEVTMAGGFLITFVQRFNRELQQDLIQ